MEILTNRNYSRTWMFFYQKQDGGQESKNKSKEKSIIHNKKSKS